MYIIFVRNYRKKIILFVSVLMLWVVMFLLSNFLINSSLLFNVTIDNSFTFSHPFSLHVENILINESAEDKSVYTNYTFRRPLAQNFSNYKSLTGKFSFNYPSAFTISQKDFPGSDILYHIDFQSKSQNSHGFVQVWNLPYPVREFLERSKAASTMDFTSFESREVIVSDMPGYLWDYSVRTKEGRTIKGSEVFLQKNDRMYRVSYFIPESSWNKAQSDIFWGMVNSFKVFD